MATPGHRGSIGNYRSFGLRAGSFERNPKRKRETKNVTTVYTKIFKVNMFVMKINL